MGGVARRELSKQLGEIVMYAFQRFGTLALVSAVACLSAQLCVVVAEEGIQGSSDITAFVAHGEVQKLKFKETITGIKLIADEDGENRGDNSDLAHLHEFSNLELLDAGERTTDKGLPYLFSVPKLRILGLMDSRITDRGMHVVSLLPLTDLGCGGTRITDFGFLAVAHLEKLEFPNVCETRISDVSATRVLPRLTRLKHLDMHETQVGDATVETLPALCGLKWLSLSRTKITDKCVPHLKQLKHLEFLATVESGISDSALDELKKALPQTEVW